MEIYPEGVCSGRLYYGREEVSALQNEGQIRRRDKGSYFSKVLLGSHIRTCVAEDIRNGSDEKTEELVELLQKLMK